MRKAITGIAVILAVATLAMAQDGGGRGNGLLIAGPGPCCPSSGYSTQAYYSMFGQNGGDRATA